QGARDNWIRTGISWATTDNLQYDEAHDLEQLAVLARFARAFPSGTPRDVVDLSRIGPALPTLLHEAREAGIPLIGGERISSVEVSEEPIEAVLDVIEGADGSQLRLGVWHEDRFVRGEELHLLGRQPHTVGVVTDVRARSTAAHPKVRLLLAPLHHRLPDALLDLHERGGTLDVPRSDR